MLSTEKLNVSVGDKKILKDFNLKIGKGEVHAIMGPNGSGKSTLSYVLAGMQDGSWPNLKQRGSLLGTERLVEIFRHGISNPEQLDAIAASGLSVIFPVATG